MAISNVAIANRALQKLGSPKRLESLTQDYPTARAMNACFEQVRDAELRRYPWSFATRRVSIPADAAQTEWGDWNRFSLPGDYLRLIRDDESDAKVDWRIEAGAEGEGLFIVTTDAAPLYIKYIARIEDPNQFDSTFVDAFACKLALETCEEITGSISRKESIKDDYKTAIADARMIGAMEKPAQEFLNDTWITARL